MPVTLSFLKLILRIIIVTDKRPVNLDLRSLKYPPMAIVSILHRISGVVMFILMPVMLCYLGQSLESLASFDALQQHLMHSWSKLIVWGFCSAWVYHVMAGIRHMLMDIGVGECVEAGRRSAVVVIVLAAISTILLGIWIW